MAEPEASESGVTDAPADEDQTLDDDERADETAQQGGQNRHHDGVLNELVGEQFRHQFGSAVGRVSGTP